MSKHAMLAVIIALLISIAGGVTYMGIQQKKANDLKEQERQQILQIQKEEDQMALEMAERNKSRMSNTKKK